MVIVNARFLTQPITGVQRYAMELSVRLKNIDNSIVFVCPKNVLQHEIFNILDAKIIGNRTGHLWEQIELLRYLKKEDLLINLCNSAPVFHYKKVATLHDIIYALYPQSCSFLYHLHYQLLMPLILQTSLKIITVSIFSRREISRYFKYQEEKIQVIYNAVGERFTVPIKIQNTLGNSTPYLISVAAITYHKNYSRMIEAFVNFSAKRGVNVRLLIVGERNHCYPKQHYNTISQASISFLGRVSDDELVSLYQNAIALVFPSLYEGFGIPPLEAQACGCPVISSNAAAMPEVLGDSALYFDPFSVVEIQRAMERIVVDRELRDLLIRKGFTNVSRFSWDDSVRKLYEIIRMKDNVSHDESEQGNDDRGSNPDP
jgi:glycosyltransferase involved in cell wall biosynthesis